MDGYTPKLKKNKGTPHPPKNSGSGETCSKHNLHSTVCPKFPRPTSKPASPIKTKQEVVTIYRYIDINGNLELVLKGKG